MNYRRLDGTEERPKRLTVDLRVHVTGRAHNIDSFCRESGSRRSQDPPRSVARWIRDIVEGILRYAP